MVIYVQNPENTATHAPSYKGVLPQFYHFKSMLQWNLSKIK